MADRKYKIVSLEEDKKEDITAVKERISHVLQEKGLNFDSETGNITGTEWLDSDTEGAVLEVLASVDCVILEEVGEGLSDNPFDYTWEQFLQLTDEQRTILAFNARRLNHVAIEEHFSQPGNEDGWIAIAQQRGNIISSGKGDTEPLSSEIEKVSQQLGCPVMVYSKKTRDDFEVDIDDGGEGDDEESQENQGILASAREVTENDNISKISLNLNVLEQELKDIINKIEESLPTRENLQLKFLSKKDKGETKKGMPTQKHIQGGETRVNLDRFVQKSGFLVRILDIARNQQVPIKQLASEGVLYVGHLCTAGKEINIKRVKTLLSEGSGRFCIENSMITYYEDNQSFNRSVGGHDNRLFLFFRGENDSPKVNKGKVEDERAV